MEEKNKEKGRRTKKMSSGKKHKGEHKREDTKGNTREKIRRGGHKQKR
jgi:hypothetical protein